MPGTNDEPDETFDPQDQAEAFDEDNLQGGDTDERRTFEELPDVEDLTQAEGDRDDDEALALDADEFDPATVGDADFEDDDELLYAAVDETREDDIDGQGPEDGFNEDRIPQGSIEGLEEVRDAAEAEGGEDDVSDFQSTELSDDDLRNMGYAEDRNRPPRGRR